MTWARLTETPAAAGAGGDDLSRGPEERPAVALELRAFATVERSVGAGEGQSHCARCSCRKEWTSCLSTAVRVSAWACSQALKCPTAQTLLRIEVRE